MTDGSVEIVIETDPSQLICSYQIERLFAGDNSCAHTGTATKLIRNPIDFFDTSAKTDEQSYSYRCIVTNECGAEVAISNLEKQYCYRDGDRKTLKHS